MIGGPRFYERAEIKDAVAYLSVLDNPADAVSLMRIANRPRRGIGDTSLQRLVTHADSLGISLWEAMADPDAAGVGTAAVKALRGFRTTMESLMAAAQELAARRARRGGAAAQRHDRGATRPSARSRRGAASRTCRSSSASPASTESSPRARRLPEFLQSISLVSDQDGIEDDRGMVTLMTLHNAKGLEFRAVFMIGMEEGIFPHSRSIEEQGDRGRAAPRLRGHDARDGAADADARDGALALRAARVQPRLPLPRRAAGRGRAGAAASVVVVELRLAAPGRLAVPTRDQRAPVAPDR